jgi:hypothetical protein
MTERLTKRSTDTTHENGVCCTHFNGKECQEFAGNCAHGCKWEEAVWSKLAHYEDLEEQGRLMVLPEGFDAQALKEELIKRHCPSFIGLDDLGCKAGKSVKVSSCFECWEKAWEGKRNETTT